MAGPPSADRLVLRVMILAAMLEGEERHDECSSNGENRGPFQKIG
ncbi:BnaAnng10560D [Brassica napus]|uniref:BnaAnng10560D protein n=1 Tax=Brassica napus TaxID=3708 RepID=A0A078IMW0_BRANA|nr:BnaAnng10560D [Brassica napus]